MVTLDQAGMAHHQLAAVQHVVRDQPVEERLDFGPEAVRFGLQLGQRLGQAVGHLDVAAPQRPQQLALVIAGNAQRVAVPHHADDQPEHARSVGTAVDQVTDEDGPPAGRMPRRDRPALLVAGQLVAEVGQQRLEFGPAAMHVADDVERAGLVPQVVEEPGPGEQRGADLGLRPQHVDPAETLLVQPAQAPPAAGLAAA